MITHVSLLLAISGMVLAKYSFQGKCMSGVQRAVEALWRGQGAGRAVEFDLLQMRHFVASPGMLQ